MSKKYEVTVVGRCIVAVDGVSDQEEAMNEAMNVMSTGDYEMCEQTAYEVCADLWESVVRHADVKALDPEMA